MQPSRIILLSLLLTLIVGCESRVGVKPELPPPAIAPEELSRLEALEAAGDHLAAAALYQAFAMKMESPGREDFLLHAAENFWQAEDIESAMQLLASLNVIGALPEIQWRKRLLEARVALVQSRLPAAVELLREAPPEEASAALRGGYRKAKAELFRLSGNLLESGRELGELDLLLSEEEARLDNQLLIIRTFSALTDTALDLLQPDPPGIQGGWMELARIIKSYSGEPEWTAALLAAWRDRYPSHPALPALLERSFQRLKEQYHRPDHLALMLPRSGPLAPAARAVMNGFMAAYYQAPPGRRPRLLFYDSSNVDGTWPLYRQAVDAGADMVIGPLDKEAVSQLARAGELEIPVLALNRAPPLVTPPENLYQFSLAPEDEARQVAEKAWLDGFTRALVLVPEGDWGGRIFESFRDRWEKLGGALLEQQRYDPGEVNLSDPVRSLLNIDESDARHRDVQSILGEKVVFEPRRRGDAEFVFFAAKPLAARLIRPLLQFHHAADLPVYTTSHVYTGKPDPKADRDLEGIDFPDIPWLLATEGLAPLSVESLKQLFPDLDIRYPRLYAMGMDSFNLLPHLARLKTTPLETLDGQTGNLYLDRINRVHRRLIWARMEKGVPKVTGYAYRLEPRQELSPAENLEPPAAEGTL